jgi:hypothetical protein
MNITRTHWVMLIAAFGAVLLTGVVHIGIREWYQPDVRYEEGSWYRSSNFSVVSLKLTNVGHSDAQNIRITAMFDDSLSDIATSDPAILFKIISGGIGSKLVTGIIERMVPDEMVYVYFATKSTISIGERKSFASNIKFNGGKGKTGEPIYSLIIGGLLGVLTGILLSYIIDEFFMKKVYKFYYGKAIEIGLMSLKNGETKDQLNIELRKKFKGIFSMSKHFINVGMSAYEIANIVYLRKNMNHQDKGGQL